MSMRVFYVILQVIGVIILFAELIYVLNQKPSNLQRDLILILINLIIGFVSYIVELQAKDIETAYVGCVLGYLGKPFAFLATLYLLLDYSHIKIPKWISLTVIMYFTALTCIVFTNEYHNLYYSSLGFDLNRVGSPLIVGHGIFWYVYMVSSFILYGAYIGIIGYEFKYAKTKQVRDMSLLLLLMMTFAIAGLALFIFGLTNSYDSTLFGTLLGSICLIVLLTKYRIFDSLSLAKESTIDESKNSMVVLDAKSNIAYASKGACLFAPELEQYQTHKLENTIIEKLDSYNPHEPIFKDNRVFELSVKSYNSFDNKICYGKSYLFTDITDQYGYNEKLRKAVDLATANIRQIQKDILIGIANIVEARDGCTGAHVKNVSYIAKLVATELSKKEKYKNIISESFIRRIEECMPLHDLGKIKIPDAILGKPGKLTPEEFAIMKTHTSIGAELIDSSIKNVEKNTKVQMAKDIALYHHEWWNGNGYPMGLKETDIPLSARIAAIADVYDALRMVRPYKQAFSKEKSIEIIKEETGTHFDPEITEAFLNIVDKLD